jgi:hypothetical protein
MRIQLFLLLIAGCATAHHDIRFEASEHTCASDPSDPGNGEELCVSGLSRGLDAALANSLANDAAPVRASDLEGRVRLSDLAFEDNAVALTYEFEIHHRGDGRVAQEKQTLRQEYRGAATLRREALLKLLVNVVVRVRTVLARNSGDQPTAL